MDELVPPAPVVVEGAVVFPPREESVLPPEPPSALGEELALLLVPDVVAPAPPLGLPVDKPAVPPVVVSDLPPDAPPELSSPVLLVEACVVPPVPPESRTPPSTERLLPCELREQLTLPAAHASATAQM